MMRRKPREVILSATISFYRLRREGNYTTREPMDNIDAPREQMEADLRRVIVADLPEEMRQIYDLSIQTRFIATRHGSIVMFFGIIVSALGVFSSYSDFFESIALVRKHAAALMKRLLEERYLHRGMDETDVTVSTDFPSLPDPADFHPLRRLRRRLGPEAEFFEPLLFQQPSAPRRDGLFWWLVISNILLAAALGTLVAAAVVKTYFP